MRTRKRQVGLLTASALMAGTSVLAGSGTAQATAAPGNCETTAQNFAVENRVLGSRVGVVEVHITQCVDQAGNLGPDTNVTTVPRNESMAWAWQANVEGAATKTYSDKTPQHQGVTMAQPFHWCANPAFGYLGWMCFSDTLRFSLDITPTSVSAATTSTTTSDWVVRRI